jgi:hypothetical protein
MLYHYLPTFILHDHKINKQLNKIVREIIIQASDQSDCIHVYYTVARVSICRNPIKLYTPVITWSNYYVQNRMFLEVYGKITWSKYYVQIDWVHCGSQSVILGTNNPTLSFMGKSFVKVVKSIVYK